MTVQLGATVLSLDIPFRPSSAQGLPAGWGASACCLLAGGSALLVAGAVGGVLESIAAVRIASYLALMVFFMGWVALGIALRGEVRVPHAGPAVIHGMVLLYAASFALFLLAPLWIDPANGIGPTSRGVWEFYAVLWSGTLPYVPMVYGPIVLAHAAILVLASRTMRPGERARDVALGGGALCGFAVAGIFGQALLDLNALDVPFCFLSGLTVLAYAMAAAGLRAGVPAPAPRKSPACPPLGPRREPHLLLREAGRTLRSHRTLLREARVEPSQQLRAVRDSLARARQAIEVSMAGPEVPRPPRLKALQ